MASAKLISVSAEYIQTTDGDAVIETYQLADVAGEGTRGYLINAGEDANIPNKGDAHPNKSNLRVRSIRATDLGNKKAQVVVEFRATTSSTTLESEDPPVGNSEGIVWNVESSLESFLTNTEADGTTRLSVQRPIGSDVADGPDVEYPELEVLRPVMILRGIRRELNPPMSRARTVAGKVNSVAHGPYGAGTLLAFPPRAHTDNAIPNPSPTSYSGWHKVEYEFHHRPEGWQEEIRWKKFDGTEPAAHDANSSKKVDVYQTENFETLLGISFTDPS